MCRACARACRGPFLGSSLPGFSSWVPNTTAPIRGCAAATPSPGPPDRGLKPPPAPRRDARLRGLAARVVGGALPVSADVPCGVVLILLRSPCQKPAKAGDPQSSLGFQPQAEGDGATSPTRSRPSVTSRSTPGNFRRSSPKKSALAWLGSDFAGTLPQQPPPVPHPPPTRATSRPRCPTGKPSRHARRARRDRPTAPGRARRRLRLREQANPARPCHGRIGRGRHRGTNAARAAEPRRRPQTAGSSFERVVRTFDLSPPTSPTLRGSTRSTAITFPESPRRARRFKSSPSPVGIEVDAIAVVDRA